MELMHQKGKASFITGGQFGSEGKGAAAAFVAKWACDHGKFFDIITTNAGAQAGHTSIHNNVTRVTRFLPSAALISDDYGGYPIVYLNAGSVLEPEGLLNEIETHIKNPDFLVIHPRAAIVAEADVQRESAEGSSTRNIASTCKGVGSAIARKVMRAAPTAIMENKIGHLRISTMDLNRNLAGNASVLVEVPQGLDLSLNSQFYPNTTSRDCTIEQAMNDAGIHPRFYGASLLVLRTYPIRVGNLDHNSSGGCWTDQRELDWKNIGRDPELTTVTKRPRRLFTFSALQVQSAMMRVRPDYVLLTFCDYLKSPGHVHDHAETIHKAAGKAYVDLKGIYFAYGPTTNDVYSEVQ